ncbi:MAG: alanine--tRNA ligase-related protein, partial [Candidatus Margulisiibacteriota bacterium]
IADHIRAMVFMLADGIYHSNEGRGYILKKILRRAVRHGKLLAVNTPFLADLAKGVIQDYGESYQELRENQSMILDVLGSEEENFTKTLDFGLTLLEDILKRASVITGEDAFKLFDTYGFPLELTQEIASEKKIPVDVDGFIALMEQQKDRARTAATFYQKDPSMPQDKPKGGEAIIAKTQEERLNMARNHSCTHLLQSALQKILGKHVAQSGSLVSPERLRFDFSHPKALTSDQLRAVETLVNTFIMNNMPVTIEHMPYDKAISAGAMALFAEKYENEVRVVTMGDCSMELCGGTHVEHTGDIGSFLITGEGAISNGVRRIEAVTGLGALVLVQDRFQTIQILEHSYKIPLKELIPKLDSMNQTIKQLENTLEKTRKNQLSDKVEQKAKSVVLDKTEKGTSFVQEFNEPFQTQEELMFYNSLLASRINGVTCASGTFGNSITTVVNFASTWAGNSNDVFDRLKKEIPHKKIWKKEFEINIISINTPETYGVITDKLQHILRTST